MTDPVQEITHDTAPGTSNSSVDWTTAFKSPDFCAGLKTAVAEAIASSLGSRSMSSNVEALEQLGEVSPSIPSTTSGATSSQASSEGMLTAPLFLGLSDSLTQSSAVDRTVNSHRTPVFQSVPAPIVASAIGSNCTQAFILGPGRPPVPAKLVSQILTGKFIELSELIPENLAAPTTESTSFIIEGRSIVPTTTSSRKKTEISDILTWVECFNSYTSVITAFHPERVRDLLAYMALIMRLAKQFPGRCWYTYDRAYRLEAAASNSKNWSQINADLYHYHTSVAAKPMQAQATRYGEPRGDPHSMIFCKSWNAGACSSPRESCRFRHKCDRNGCGGTHRRIHCTELARKRGRSPGEDPSRQRQPKRA